jgi:hypothetical protein
MNIDEMISFQQLLLCAIHEFQIRNFPFIVQKSREMSITYGRLNNVTCVTMAVVKAAIKLLN